ncbi:AbrB family transcriptional regulator [Rubrobacter marinus]|uniref:AbrB family transcriptional regulator n=1 Tax=Rubrobacter marinus TaxID=2653852 RepID=UPI001409F6B2|nr:AbrB family transcriptional regulator [Rubrobacter marinus]
MRLLPLAVGAAGAGLVAQGLSVPAAWLVGPMLVAILLALARPEARPRIPGWTRRASQAVVGIVIASTFQPAVLPLVAREWFAVGLAVGSTVLLSLGASVVLARFAPLDGRTAALGTLPGAASAMSLLGEPLGADPRLVALMQYGRVVLVVASAAIVARLGAPAPVTAGFAGLEKQGVDPLIQNLWAAYAVAALVAVVGGWVGARLALPAGGLLGPLLLGVALQEARILDLALPAGVPPLAYALIGIHVGLLFDRTSLRRAGGLLPSLLASTLSLMLASAGMGWVFSALTNTDYLTAFLATTPGGIDSIAVMAVGSGADASLVVAVQTMRLLAVVLVGALLDRRWSARR